MKKKLIIGQICAVLLAFLAIIIISTIVKKAVGSGDKKLTPDSSGSNVEVSNVSISDTGAESDSVDFTDGEGALSQGELDYFTDWIQTDYNYAFCLSDYNDVSAMDLGQLTYDFEGGVDELGISEQDLAKEYTAVTKYSIETDVTMYTDAALRAYLIKWANITTEDLLYKDKPTSEKYGVYMHQHGDTNNVHFTACSGEKYNDGSCHVYYESEDGTLATDMFFAKKDDGFIVTSNHIKTCYFYVWNSSANPSDFIFPHSECSYITKSDLESATQADCKIARNEIFARYGLKFKDKELSSYFSQFSWYEPQYTSEEINHDSLNLIEKRNLKMIQDYETEKGWR